MRVCSLLPSATEIISELGLIDSLLGVSDDLASLMASASWLT